MNLSITLILIAATAVVSILAFQRSQLFEALLFSPFAVQHRGQWYRMLSHAFVHADWPHLLVNMFVLWSFGSSVEVLYGMISPLPSAAAYVMLYVGGIVCATFPGMAKHRNDPRYRSVGASGAVSAVLFAHVLMMPTQSITLFFIQSLPAWLFGVLYLIYSYAMDKRGGDNVAHDAHFYGAVFGVLFTAAMDPNLVLDLGYLERSLGI